MDAADVLTAQQQELVDLAARLSQERFAPPGRNGRLHRDVFLREPEGARHLLHEAARARAAGDRRAKTLAMNRAKYAASEAGVAITQLALRLCGGRGILKSFPLERHLRDAMAGPVMPPSNDRCLETIGKLVLGLEAATLEFT